MGKLRYIPAARRDLLELWVSIASENPKAADRVIDRIEAACAHLRDHPMLGPARPKIGAGARVLIIERWLALYKVEPGGVQIVRVVDGARDLEKLLWIPEANDK